MAMEVTPRAQARAALETAQATLRSAVANLPEDHLAVPFLGEWSTKDILLHLTTWDELVSRDIQRLSRGNPPALAAFRIEQVDDWNDALLRGRRQFPTDQVIAELDEAWAGLRSALEMSPEALLAEGQPVRTFCDLIAQHKQGHAEQVRQWRQAPSSHPEASDERDR